jgi:hypothetical protein
MLIPKYDENNVKIGSVPSRGSKNPIVGVIRCECGDVASVHDPKGKRAGYFYTICDQCKTDQRSGEPRQAYLRANMKATVEQLAPGLIAAIIPGEQGPQQIQGQQESEKGAKAAPLLALDKPEPAQEGEKQGENQGEKQAEKQAEQAKPETPSDKQTPPSEKSALNPVKAGLVGAAIGIILGLIA